MDEPFFVDWLTLRQSHPHELPIINAGVVCGINTNGEIEWKTMRATALHGSYDTSVQIRCDGHTVLFSGNVSRFGRTNNLFGFSLAQCIRRVNNVLHRLGLPPFTAGSKFYRNVNTENGTLLKAAWTGCQITRIDLTANYETGSLSNSRAYLEWLSTQQGNARLKVGPLGPRLAPPLYKNLSQKRRAAQTQRPRAANKTLRRRGPSSVRSNR
jgi:hypothetical protein